METDDIIPLWLFSTAENLMAAAVLIEKQNRENRSKRCWIKNWRKTRASSGNIQALLNEFKLSFDNDKFKSYLRMDETCFLRLLSIIEHDIGRNNTRMRDCIPAPEKLAATLRYLATGETFKELDEHTKLSESFLRSAIMEVCESIYKNGRQLFLKFPDSKEKWVEIANDFEERWQFPLCLGALDGKHVAFKPKKKNAQMFHNYKGFKSVVLLAMSDANAKFTFVDIGCNGRISDGGVLSRSDLMEVIKNVDQYFPPSRLIGENRKLPYVIIGDNSFPLLENLMTPYPYTTRYPKKILFNYRLSRARQNIERAFGILSNRFHVIQKGINLTEEKAKIIIKACCVLHNFLIINSSWYLQSTSPPDTNNPSTSQLAEEAVPEQEFRSANIAKKNRETFANYFSNEGKI